MKSIIKTVQANRLNTCRLLVAAAAATSLLVACGGSDSDAGSTPASASPKGAITGQLLDAATGTAVAGVQVSAGGVTAVSDAQGRYNLAGVLAGERVIVKTSTSTYADMVSIASVLENTTSTMNTKLLKAGATATIDNAAGGVVSVSGSSAQVTLPVGAFGASGTVSVQITPINPALDASLMPGDYRNATGQNIESFGALVISPKNAAGQDVNLAAGKSATIRIPATSKGGVLDASIPLFFLDTATGNWVQEGTATLAGTAPNQYYQGTVTHFSTWNADKVLDTVKFNGCVKDSTGAPVSGVRVTSDGINYSGYASAVTNSSGTFSVSMKKSATAVISGQKAGAQTNSVSKTSGAVDFTDTNCLQINQSASGSVKIKLTWGADPVDIDSHLYTPSGEHVYFSNDGRLDAAPFASLDVDDVTSFGPEVVTINRLMVGKYVYGIHLYEGSGTMTASPARVELTIGNAVRVFTVPAGETASTKFARLFSLTVDARCNITVESIGSLEAEPPGIIPGNSTPAYCTP